MVRFAGFKDMLHGLRAAATGSPIGREFFKIIDDEDGVVTIEFVMWMPGFMLMLGLIVDFSFIFLTNASMWDAARDGARRLALGKVTEQQAEDYVRRSLYSAGREFAIDAIDGEEVAIVVRTSMNEASVFRVYGHLLPGELVARVYMQKEPN